MEISPRQFVPAFLAAARKLSPELPVPPMPVDEVAAPLSWSNPLARLQQHLLGRKQRPLMPEGEMRQALQLACQALGGPLSAAIAAEVGRQLVSPESESALGSRESALVNRCSAPELENDWNTVRAHAKLPVPATFVAGTSGFGPARFLGSAAFFSEQELSRLPREVRLFIMAHELGHIENRDAAGKLGVRQLVVLTDGSIDENASSREMEFAADRRAAEIAAREGCSPEPILAELLTWRGGGTHPEPLARATAVRETMALHGQSLSEERWQELVAETAPIREQHVRQWQESEALRAFFDELT